MEQHGHLSGEILQSALTSSVFSHVGSISLIIKTFKLQLLHESFPSWIALTFVFLALFPFVRTPLEDDFIFSVITGELNNRYQLIFCDDERDPRERLHASHFFMQRPTTQLAATQPIALREPIDAVESTAAIKPTPHLPSFAL